jgi:hypothetical protein
MRHNQAKKPTEDGCSFLKEVAISSEALPSFASHLYPRLSEGNGCISGGLLNPHGELELDACWYAINLNINVYNK